MTSRGIMVVALAVTALLASDAVADANEHFVSKVKPLLESRCVSCHGPEKQKGGLRLDSRGAIIKGGESGRALVPGQPGKSLIVQAVLHNRPNLEMPPKEKLTAGDVAVLEEWIRDGAPWPEQARGVAQARPAAVAVLGNAWSDPNNPIVKIFGGRRLDLWSLKPIGRPTPPVVDDGGWSRNAIDRFVFASLERAGLRPSPEADRRTLIRRLSYDLIGLPPAHEEVANFLADESSDAYEKLVERLLASPRYGEHQARQWLDVVRYSDSNGFDWDEFRPNAWRFRDYVIRSFNADKPFDAFIREQLAGDELLDGPPRTPAEQDQLIATGYLRIGPQDNSSALFNEQARSRAELMADLVETTGSAFLGLTFSCCRCHDHKFDPLSQADHFRMRAFFEPAKYADDRPVDFASEQESIRKQHEGVDVKLAPVQERRDALLEGVKDRLRRERFGELSANERRLLLLSEDKVTPELKGRIEAVKRKADPREKDVLAALSPDQKKEHEALGKQIEELKKQKRPFTHALQMTDGDGKAVTRVLYQGDHRQEREEVEPGFISVLDPNAAAIVKPGSSRTTGRRLTLANWIVSPKNPLMARVLANRIWQGHFSRGLVATPNDFGLAGERPSHPELLDYLATELLGNGWSVKHLHRLIVTSAAYRQSSKIEGSGGERIDGRNELLWRQHLRRLSAEQLRDSLLAVSGVLRHRDGGAPIWPELPPEVLQANPAFLDDNAEKTKGWYPSPPEQRNVRSIYLVQKRTVRIPFMETFDLPENATSCPERKESIVAPQALSLMNGALAVGSARSLAARVTETAGAGREAQVRHAFYFALQREPGELERQACLQLLEDRSLLELCRALLNLNEFSYLD